MINAEISIWEETFYSDYDVVIVGGGFSGMSLAISLKEKSSKLKVAVLEKNILPKGASTRNAGFACFGSLTELLSDLDLAGEEAMLNLVQKRISGLELIKARFGAGAIDYQDFGGFEVLETKNLQDLDRMPELNYLLSPILGKEVFKVANDKIENLGFDSGWCNTLVMNTKEGQLHPGKLHLAQRQLASQLGVQLFFGIEVLSFVESNNIKLTTSSGQIFQSKKVVFATNAWTSDFFSDLDIKPGRGTIMLSQKIDLPFNGSFHIEEGYYYFRDFEGRLLIGGGRHLDKTAEESFDLGQNPLIKDAILNKCKYILPYLEIKVEKWWSGTMAFGKEKSPVVKMVKKNIWVMARMSGMGVALSSALGDSLADEILENNEAKVPQ
jgi:glycine/D-amino acid oxidase-like deaminating enzyme